MKRTLLSPLLAPAIVCIFWGMLLSAAACRLLSAAAYHEGGVVETITYAFYGVALAVALAFGRDFMRTPKQASYFLFLFLWLAALLREMGAQHWLASRDTTAIKIRFFTNPQNPLSEKIAAALIVLVIAAAVVFLLVRWLPFVLRGFWKGNPLAWTIAAFMGVGIVAKIVDRFPANYHKMTGLLIDERTDIYLKLIEEGGEALLPLLFALAVVQHHFLKKS